MVINLKECYIKRSSSIDVLRNKASVKGKMEKSDIASLGGSVPRISFIYLVLHLLLEALVALSLIVAVPLLGPGRNINLRQKLNLTNNNFAI
jgi:hypothetical protein